MKWNESVYTELLKQCTLTVYGTITFSDGSTRDITNADIPHGGVVIEKRAVTGDNFEVGGAIVGELDLKLRISNSEDPVKYYDAIIDLKCEVNSDLSVTTEQGNLIGGFNVSLGIWTFVDVKKRKNILEILAYDSLINLDKRLKSDLVGSPEGIMYDIQNELGIEFRGTDLISGFIKGPYSTPLSFPVYGGRCTTYRQVISAIAQMSGCFVIERTFGQIEFKRFDNSPQTSLEFTSGNIYSSNISAYTYAISSLVTEFDDTQLVYTGTNATSGQIYHMQNPIILEMLRNSYSNDPSYAITDVINSAHEKLGNILISMPEYRPCELTTIADPRIECGDRFILRHEGGVDEIVVTGYVWKLHDKMEITCAGKDERLARPSSSSSNYNSYYINEVEQNSLDNSAIILHKLSNAEKVVSDEDFKLIASATFVANRDTFVTFTGTLQVDVDVDDITEDAQITIPRQVVTNSETGEIDIVEESVTYTVPYKRDGHVDVQLLYKFNSDWIGPRYKHTLTRGSHIITLHYPILEIKKFSVSSFGVYISSSVGNVSIDKGMFIGTITGQGIAKALTWDGAIVLEDFTSQFTIPETDVTFADFNEQVNCEDVTRNDSNFSDLVDNEIIQSMTMVNIDDTLQLSTEEGE